MRDAVLRDGVRVGGSMVGTLGKPATVLVMVMRLSSELAARGKGNQNGSGIGKSALRGKVLKRGKGLGSMRNSGMRQEGRRLA